MSTRDVIAVCPYCGHGTRIVVHEYEENRPKVVLCEVEDGPGCDRYFAAQVTFVPQTKTFTMNSTTR